MVVVFGAHIHGFWGPENVFHEQGQLKKAIKIVFNFWRVVFFLDGLFQLTNQFFVLKALLLKHM